MAGEIQVAYQAAATVYVLIRNRNGAIWNGSTFETYVTANYATYTVSLTEQGSASGFYAGTFPAGITTPGVYSIVAKRQSGGSPAETDSTIATGDLQWNGSTTLPLSDTATSGQIGQISPIRLARGTMITNFPLYLKSSLDHITPFTSGVISGQISRDNGSFGALQSGAFTETGLGWYNLQALTSGDLLANTVRLHFTAVGVSGGAADPLPMSFILQRTSGQ